jgi:hypothetical protein
MKLSWTLIRNLEKSMIYYFSLKTLRVSMLCRRLFSISAKFSLKLFQLLELEKILIRKMLMMRKVPIKANSYLRM